MNPPKSPPGAQHPHWPPSEIFVDESFWWRERRNASQVRYVPESALSQAAAEARAGAFERMAKLIRTGLKYGGTLEGALVVAEEEAKAARIAEGGKEE